MKKLTKKQISIIAVSALVLFASSTTVSVKAIHRKNITSSLNEVVNSNAANEVENATVEELSSKAFEETTTSNVKESELGSKTQQTNKSNATQTNKANIAETQDNNTTSQATTENTTKKNYKVPISDQTIKAIENDFRVSFLKDTPFEDSTITYVYKGTYDGYVIGFILYGGGDCAIHENRVGKYVFQEEIYAWKDSKKFTLNELYNNGALSEETWEALNAECGL